MPTFDEIFRNPTPDIAEAIKAERNAGLEELELLVGGLMHLRSEQARDGVGKKDNPVLINSCEGEEM